MKTITIPKRFGYPTLDITINGKIYTVKSGEEITVEDSVAEAIENAIALEPKTRKNISLLGKSVDGSITEILAEDIDGITSIVTYAFYNCFNIKKVTIPKSVVSIASRAFCGCVSLETVVFSDGNLDSIGESTFDWCGKLSSVYLPTTPPTLENVNAFQNISAACVFYCKTQESLEAYLSATNWSTLADTYTFTLDT